MVDEGDMFGDGVNVAARIEALAAPGEICVSYSVREQVSEKLPVRFSDLGEHSVMNIARPVRVYRVEKGAEPYTGVAEAQTQDPLDLADRPSLAVMPFTNMSGDAEQEYFVDGIVEDIITGLSRLRWLHVVARNSTFTYKGRAVDVKQVGRELGVRYVLEGSMRKAGNRVRVTAQLIAAASGTHVWAERYDRGLDDIFELQDEITLSVVGATVVAPCLRLLDQSCDDAGDRIEHAPDIVGSARLTLEFGHDNLEQLISELGCAVGIEHVASKELVQSGPSGQIERRFPVRGTFGGTRRPWNGRSGWTVFTDLGR